MLAAVCGVQIFFVKRYVLLISACPGLGFCGTQPAADTPPGSFPQTFRGPAHHLSPRCRTSPCPLRAVLTSGLRLVPASPPTLHGWKCTRVHVCICPSHGPGCAAVLKEGGWWLADAVSRHGECCWHQPRAPAARATHSLSVLCIGGAAGVERAHPGVRREARRKRSRCNIEIYGADGQ